jgi:hypothetical protein
LRQLPDFYSQPCLSPRSTQRSSILSTTAPLVLIAPLNDANGRLSAEAAL